MILNMPTDEQKIKNYTKNKKYYDKNKQVILEKNKEYRDKTPEYWEKKKEKIKCERCGALIAKNDFAKHKKTKKCINTEPEKIISAI